MDQENLNILNEELNARINELSEEELENPEVIFDLINKLQISAFELGSANTARANQEVDIVVNLTSEDVADAMKALIARGGLTIGLSAN